MKQLTVIRGLVAVVVFQLLVLSGEYLTSVFPLWFGEPVILKIRPVDPRSLFRGNYVALNYDIAQLQNVDGLRSLGPIKSQDILYVGLSKKDGYHQPTSVSNVKPSEGLFIRGRVLYQRGTNVDLKYGIEAYFAAKDRALDIEKGIRDSGRRTRVATSSVTPESEAKKDEIPYARVRVLSNGKAALEELQWGLESP